LGHFDRRVIIRVSADLDDSKVYELHNVEGNEGLRPVGLDFDRGGHTIVLYEDGLIQVLDMEPAEGPPAVLRSHRLGVERRPEFIRLAVTDDGWFHATFRPAAGWLTYDTQGNRRMAAEPGRSLFGAEISRASVIAAAGNDVFVHDEDSGIIWKVR
jgi:hypothetical protein